MMPSISLAILLIIVSSLNLSEGGGDEDGGHHHVIIHVPYHIKKIKHTHTITKHIHHGGGDKYEVLGYTVGHPIDLGGHGNYGSHLGGHYGGHYGGYGGHSFEEGGNELGHEGQDFYKGHGNGLESFGGGDGYEETSSGY